MTRKTRVFRLVFQHAFHKIRISARQKTHPRNLRVIRENCDAETLLHSIHFFQRECKPPFAHFGSIMWLMDGIAGLGTIGIRLLEWHPNQLHGCP